MTGAPYATRMTARAVADDRARLAQEAQRIAEAATRFAQDVDHGIDVGDHDRLARDAHDLLGRAIRYKATRDTAALFTSELTNPEETTG